MSQTNLRRKPHKSSITESISKEHPEAAKRSTHLPKCSVFSSMLLASSALLAAFSLHHYRNSSRKNPDLLPTSYAICSPYGKAIYTVDERNTNVQCLLVHDSSIVYTGSLETTPDGVKEFWNAMQNVTFNQALLQAESHMDFDIRFLPREAIVVPGMTDAHGHILEYGASRLLSLEGSGNSTAAVTRVRDYILSHPDVLNDTSRFIEGWGWDHTSWPVEKFPSYKELESDPVVRGRPIILQSKDGHAQWVSAAILQSILPLPDTVHGGMIVRDEMDKPTGVFLDKAQDLIKKPSLTDADRMLRFDHAVKDALSKGLTSLHDAGFDPASLKFFKKMADLGKLPIRVYGMTYFDEHAEYWGNKRTKIIDHNRLTARSVKMFADGALRSGGAALFEPYADNPGTSGFMRIDPDILYKFVPMFLSDGWQVNIHAIGDRANSIILDVMESALNKDLKGANGTALRPRIEHAQIILPADAVRLAELGVIASVQPTHVVSDMWYAQDRLGSERVRNLYAFRTIIDAGARVALGSDFPVEDMNPLAGFHAATTRLSSDGRSPHGPSGWFPEQRLTRIEALRGFTIDPAYASFTENNLGSLEPGKIADYVILSRDIMTIPTKHIMDVKVLATVIDGRLVFGTI